jgi:hypothetical protein
MPFGNALQVRASNLVINNRDSGSASTLIKENVPSQTSVSFLKSGHGQEFFVLQESVLKKIIH